MRNLTHPPLNELAPWLVAWLCAATIHDRCDATVRRLGTLRADDQ